MSDIGDTSGPVEFKDTVFMTTVTAELLARCSVAVYYVGENSEPHVP